MVFAAIGQLYFKKWNVHVMAAVVSDSYELVFCSTVIVVNLIS